MLFRSGGLLCVECAINGGDVGADLGGEFRADQRGPVQDVVRERGLLVLPRDLEAERDAGHRVTFFVTGMHMMDRYGLTRNEVRRTTGALSDAASLRAQGFEYFAIGR